MKYRAVFVLLSLLPALLPTPASAAPSLPAPTITSAVVTSATSIDVAWTSVDRATGYDVRWTAYGEAQILRTTSTSVRLQVFAATPYTIEVRAVGRNVTSPWSAPVFLTTPPAPPSSVVATALRPDTVQLTWATGYGEAGYEVYAVAPDGTLEGPLSVREYGAPNRVLVSTTAETTSSYVVVSVAFDGQRSVPSETVTVTTPPRWPSGLVIPVYGPVDEGVVTLSAYVQNAPDDPFVTFGGEVTFTVDGGEPMTVPLLGGIASIQVELAAGTYDVAAAWSGDSAYLPSSTTAVIEVRPVLVHFTPPEVLTVAGTPFSAAVGDVTGDGRPDIVLVAATDAGYQLQLRAGLADGSFANPTGRPVPAGSEQVALGDLDRDGDADAVVASPDGVLISAGSPAGLGAPSLRRTTGSATDVEVAEVTGDALPDVVVSTTAALQVLPGSGRLTTGRAQTIAGGMVTRIQVGNTTGGGRLDVAGIAFAPESSAAVVVWTPTGTGWTEAFRETAVTVEDITLGDVTGDGLADLAWTATVDYPDSQVQLRIGPAFRPLAVPYAPPVSGVATGDLDGDGRDNLVAGPENWSTAQVWRVTDDEVSPPAPVDLGQFLRASAVLVTDVSGDDLDDLLVLDPTAGLVILRRA